MEGVFIVFVLILIAGIIMQIGVVGFIILVVGIVVLVKNIKNTNEEIRIKRELEEKGFHIRDMYDELYDTPQEITGLHFSLTPSYKNVYNKYNYKHNVAKDQTIGYGGCINSGTSKCVNCGERYTIIVNGKYQYGSHNLYDRRMCKNEVVRLTGSQIYEYDENLRKINNQYRGG